MNIRYVIAAYRVAKEEQAPDRRIAGIKFVASLADWMRQRLPKDATAELCNSLDSHNLKTWKSRQAAHQWLVRNEAMICHQGCFDFPTSALAYEILSVPTWLVDPNARGAPRRFKGMVARR